MFGTANGGFRGIGEQIIGAFGRQHGQHPSGQPAAGCAEFQNAHRPFGRPCRDQFLNSRARNLVVGACNGEVSLYLIEQRGCRFRGLATQLTGELIACAGSQQQFGIDSEDVFQTARARCGGVSRRVFFVPAPRTAGTRQVDHFARPFNSLLSRPCWSRLTPALRAKRLQIKALSPGERAAIACCRIGVQPTFESGPDVLVEAARSFAAAIRVNSAVN